MVERDRAGRGCERGRERKADREHREPGTPGDADGQQGQQGGCNGDRERSVRSADCVLESIDPEQEWRVLLVVGDAVRGERDTRRDGEEGDREEARRKPRRPPAFQVEREPRQHEWQQGHEVPLLEPRDRKSTRLNSSHPSISYAVFCLKKKT